MTMKRVINQDGKYGLVDITPAYGENYNKGYIGFCYDPRSLVSKAIAKATKYCNYSNIEVSHALIVISEDLCIEADANSKLFQNILMIKTKLFPLENLAR